MPLERKKGCGEMVLRERGRREEGDAVRGGCAHVGARAARGRLGQVLHAVRSWDPTEQQPEKPADAREQGTEVQKR